MILMVTIPCTIGNLVLLLIACAVALAVLYKIGWWLLTR